jgi:hypothetical protein
MRQLFQKRWFILVLCVLLWSLMLIRGAHALFSDTAGLTGSTITTGTVSLLVSNSQSPTTTLYDKTRDGFALNLVPGDTVERFFFLKNDSDANVDFDISMQPTITQGMGDTMSQMASLQVVPVDDAGQPLDGFQPVGGALSSLATKTTALTGVTIAHGTAQRFMLRVTLDPAFTQQADTLAFDLVFTGQQHLQANQSI